MAGGTVLDGADRAQLQGAATLLASDVGGALGELASLAWELANPDLDLHYLGELRADLDELVAWLRRGGHASVLTDAAIACRTLAVWRIGRKLVVLPDQSGRRTGEPTELQRAAQELGVNERTARRWRALGEAPRERVDAYIAPALDALERSIAGEGSLDSSGDPGVRLSTQRLLQLLRSESVGAADAAARADRDDDDDGMPSLDLPDGMIEVCRRVLGSVDRHIGKLGMRDPDWRGRVIVTPPPTSAVPYGDHLRRRYERGAVSDAILIVGSPQDSSWWRPFAGRPHCLLANAPKDRPPVPLTVFLCSGSAEVHERFVREFRRLGYVYPEGAVVEIGPADGGAGPAAARAAA